MSRVHPFFFAISGKSLVCRRPLLFASMMPNPSATVVLCFLVYLCFLRTTLGRLTDRFCVGGPIDIGWKGGMGVYDYFFERFRSL